MSVIAITQIIESAINVTLTALQGKVQRVVNTGASSITVTLGSGGSTVSVATGAFVDCWYSGTTWYSFLNSTDNVKTAGAQTIADVKTFSSIPVLPASDPTTDNQAVRKKYADDTFLKLTAKASPKMQYNGSSQGNNSLLSNLYTALAGIIATDDFTSIVPICGSFRIVENSNMHIVSHMIRYDATTLYLYCMAWNSFTSCSATYMDIGSYATSTYGYWDLCW